MGGAWGRGARVWRGVRETSVVAGNVMIIVTDSAAGCAQQHTTCPLFEVHLGIYIWCACTSWESGRQRTTLSGQHALWQRKVWSEDDCTRL